MQVLPHDAIFGYDYAVEGPQVGLHARGAVLVDHDFAAYTASGRALGFVKNFPIVPNGRPPRSSGGGAAGGGLGLSSKLKAKLMWT